MNNQFHSSLEAQALCAGATCCRSAVYRLAELFVSECLLAAACRMLGKAESLLELSGHSHWVWNCCYSPQYDQLLLTSSTDTTVCVWYTPAVAKLKGTAQKQVTGGKSGSSFRYIRLGYQTVSVCQPKYVHA